MYTVNSHSMTIGLIADEFTDLLLSLEEEVKLIRLTPNNWRFMTWIHKLDCLLVESAWRGHRGKWSKKIAFYENFWPDHLKKLVEFCKSKKIPTVFWNKEDPINFKRFKHNVVDFDVCLTTEEELVNEYKKLMDKTCHVSVQSFFYQGKLHSQKFNVRLEEYKNKYLFAGGLYLHEFPDRARRLLMAVDALGSQNMIVFDRFKGMQDGWPSIDYLKIENPFNYRDSLKVYQSGIMHLNVNSCDGSRTMFSRRMLELIVSGAHVMDLTNHKGKSCLSEFVTQVSTKEEIMKAKDSEKPKVDFGFIEEKFSVKNFLNKLKNVA